MEQELPESGAPISVWIGLIGIAAVSFWSQAAITEERFVPALNVIATEFNIPDDVAGATLMAAGASSPELFSSFVSLFITHSALGLGTIVGSEIFNQLIICAGAVWASKTGSLQLDPAILTREVGFYALSIALLWYALHDTRPDPFDPNGVNRIYISFIEAAIVFGAYILYVLVCAHMDTIVAIVKQLRGIPTTQPFHRKKDHNDSKTYGSTSNQRKEGDGYSRSVDLSDVAMDIPYMHDTRLAREPESNFKMVEYSRTRTGEPSWNLHEQSSSVHSNQSNLITSTLRHFAGGNFPNQSMRQFQLILETTRPSTMHGLYDVENNDKEHSMNCFLWQRSYFYNKSKFATKGWLLRWFTISSTQISSVPDRTHAEHRRIIYPHFLIMEVDYARLIIRMRHREDTRRDFYFMAPSEEIMQDVVTMMEQFVKKNHEHTEIVNDEPTEEEKQAFHHGDEFESLIEFPATGSNLTIFFFVVLFPIRFLMHYTVPDVRILDIHGEPVTNKSIGLRGNAFLAIIGCLLWLVVGSYAMVASLEHLADLLKIPAAVVGVSVSAVGTSLPNYVGSKVAAEKGFGNMAVSNAFGSNTFNIMVGLGLPWLIYTSIGTGFQPYNGLRDEGITESVTILALVLLVFIVAMIISGCKLYKWHATLFVVLYIAYLVYAIGEVYW